MSGRFVLTLEYHEDEKEAIGYQYGQLSTFPIRSDINCSSLELAVWKGLKEIDRVEGARERDDYQRTAHRAPDVDRIE